MKLFVYKIIMLFWFISMILFNLIILPLGVLGTLYTGLVRKDWQKKSWTGWAEAWLDAWDSLTDFLAS